MSPPLVIAVVIPARNEALRLGPLVARLRQTAAPPAALGPVVVADSASTDGTAAAARAAGARVVSAPAAGGRGGALRAGVAAAPAAAPPPDALWLLHADSHPPRTWPADLAAVLADPRTVAGAFPLRFRLRGHDVTAWTKHKLHFASMCNRLRYRRSGVYLGDQGLFVRPDALEAAGGVPDRPLFEDVELVQALRRLGPVRLTGHRLSTSPRRFLDTGVITQLCRDLRLLWRHRRGALPPDVVAAYEGEKFPPTGAPRVALLNEPRP